MTESDRYGLAEWSKLFRLNGRLQRAVDGAARLVSRQIGSP